MSIPKRFTIITITVYFVFLFFLLVGSFFQFEPKMIDPIYRLEWMFNYVFIHFFTFLIPAQCLAIILTFSLFLPNEFLYSEKIKTKSLELNTNITLVICILILLTALFFAGNEIVKPSAQLQLNNLQKITQTTRNYLSQAEDAVNNGDFILAEDLIAKYLFFKPGDEEGEKLKTEINKRIENAQMDSERTNKDKPKSYEPLNLTAQEAVSIARSYLEQEDYYSAYYYAQIALNISNKIEEALGISSRAWDKLSKMEPSKQEIDEYRLFYQKKTGIDFLLSGRSIEAYYLFKKLIADYPNDKDVREYFNESVKSVNRLAFFIDDAKRALSFPGRLNICFLNKNTDTEIEICFFGKMADVEGGIFFKDIEVITLNRNGGIINHMSAPYGKLVDDHILLSGIDKNIQRIETSAEYYVKDYIPELSNAIKLNISTQMLAGLSTEDNILTLLDLFELKKVINNLGRSAKPLNIEIINRILKPCEFILLSLFMIVVAWKARRRRGKMPLFGIIFIPVIFYLLVLFTNTVQYGNRLLSSWIYLSFGGTVAIIFLSVSQIVMIIIAFLLLAELNIGKSIDAKG